MKQKPFTLIEGNSEINSDNFYDKVNKIIEEERKKNKGSCAPKVKNTVAKGISYGTRRNGF